MIKYNKINYAIIETDWKQEIQLYGNKKLMRIHLIKRIQDINPEYEERQFLTYQTLVDRMAKLKKNKELKLNIKGHTNINIRIGYKTVITGNTTQLK